MPTDVAICKRAMLKVGLRPINSFTDGSAEANVCRDVYPGLRDAYLSSFDWSFLFGQANLVQDATAPSPDDSWLFSFQLPADLYAVLSFHFKGNDAGLIDYALAASSKIFANVTSGTLDYTKTVTEAAFPPLFKYALEWQIAAETVMSLVETDGPARAGFAAKQFEVWDLRAKAMDSQQRPTKHLPNTHLTGDR